MTKIYELRYNLSLFWPPKRMSRIAHMKYPTLYCDILLEYVRYNLTSILQHSIIRHINYTTHFPATKFIVLIYLHTTTTSLIIWQFLDPICHITKVINVHTWLDPHMFHFHMRLTFWNMHGTVTLGNIVNMGGGTLGNVVSIFLPYKCSFILMYLYRWVEEGLQGLVVCQWKWYIRFV